MSGTKESALYISDLLSKKLSSNPKKNVVIALDGYSSAQFDQTVNLISQNMGVKSIKVSTFDVAELLKTSAQLDEEFAENLPTDRVKDPVLLYGKLFKGTYKDVMDAQKLEAFGQKLKSLKAEIVSVGEIIIVYGLGCAIPKLRSAYDYILFFDEIGRAHV